MGKTGIVAFAFGTPSNIQSNIWIAEIAAQKALQTGAPVYTQMDVNIEEPRVAVIRDPEEIPGQPPSTLRMARNTVRWAKQQRISFLWLIAAKPHLWRAQRDLKAAAKEETGLRLAVVPCWKIREIPEQMWFCPESNQIYIRSQMVWERREDILKILPFAIYNYIAS